MAAVTRAGALKGPRVSAPGGSPPTTERWAGGPPRPCRSSGAARKVLRELFGDRIAFTPHRDERGAYYTFEGEGVLGKLFAGLAAPQGLVSPTGFEPVFPD